MRAELEKPPSETENPAARQALVDLHRAVDARPDPEIPFEVAMQISMIEKICLDTICRISGHLGALAECVSKGVTGNERLSDITFAICRNEARLAAIHCRPVQTDDPLMVVAREMLFSFVWMMNRVKPDRDSGPGIYIADQWRLRAYKLLCNRFGPNGSAEACMEWKNAAEEFGRRLAGKGR